MVAGAAADQARQRVAYIAMEFVKGRELRDFFEANERFALKDVERLMGRDAGRAWAMPMPTASSTAT